MRCNPFRGQHVRQEATNELAGRQRHGLIAVRAFDPVHSLIDMQAFKRRVREQSRTERRSQSQTRHRTDTGRRPWIDGGRRRFAIARSSADALVVRAAVLTRQARQLAGQLFPRHGMPTPMIADSLNFNLRFVGGVEDVGVLLTEDGPVSELRAVIGPNYGRVWDADIVDLLVDRFGDGINGQWRVPGEFGHRVTVTKENTTLSARDRDMFVFLADEENRIELPGRRAGRAPASTFVGITLPSALAHPRECWIASPSADLRVPRPLTQTGSGFPPTRGPWVPSAMRWSPSSA